MARIDQLIPDPPGRQAPRAPAVRGTVVAPIPAADTESLHVAVVGYARSMPFEVSAGQWLAHAIPSAGDRVLVLFDDAGDAWAIAGGLPPA